MTELTLREIRLKLVMTMEYELKLDDLLKSLTELGIDTDKLTIVEKSPSICEGGRK